MANRRGAKIKSWAWGNKTFKITQTFKEHQAKGGLSKRAAGIDVGTSMGTDLFSKEAGEALWSYTDKSNKCQVITIKHKSCFREYVHLSRRLVVGGQKVKKGQRIGKSGNSGLSTGSHTHYAKLVGTNYDTAKRVDPYSDLIPKPDPCAAIKKKLTAQYDSLRKRYNQMKKRYVAERNKAILFDKKLTKVEGELKEEQEAKGRLFEDYVATSIRIGELDILVETLTKEAGVGRIVIQLIGRVGDMVKRVLEPISVRLKGVSKNG